MIGEDPPHAGREIILDASTPPAPYTFIQDLRSAASDVPPDSILSRTVYADDLVKVTAFTFAAGQELSEHTASRPAILHFLEGEALVTLGQDEKRATTGTWIHMTANLVHSIRAETPVSLLLLLLKGGERG
jgi:quercetin dioxygenase-like cupin family protein